MLITTTISEVRYADSNRKFVDHIKKDSKVEVCVKTSGPRSERRSVNTKFSKTRTAEEPFWPKSFWSNWIARPPQLGSTWSCTDGITVSAPFPTTTTNFSTCFWEHFLACLTYLSKDKPASWTNLQKRDLKHCLLDPFVPGHAYLWKRCRVKRNAWAGSSTIMPDVTWLSNRPSLSLWCLSWLWSSTVCITAFSCHITSRFCNKALRTHSSSHLSSLNQVLLPVDTKATIADRLTCRFSHCIQIFNYVL